MHFKFNSDALIARGKDGGGGGYSPPAAPDPAATAAAQAKADRSTAQANALLLNPSMNTPYGQVTYDVNSYDPATPDAVINRPTQTTILGPDQQKQLDLRNNIMNSLGGLGQNWADTFESRNPLQYRTDNIPQNINYGNVDPVKGFDQYGGDRETATKAYYDAAYRMMKPDLDQQRDFLDNRLIQSGNPLSSEAYMTQMGNYDRGRDQSLRTLADQAITQGYGIQNQTFNNANLTRQNQIAAAQLPYQTESALSADQFGREQNQQNQNINALAALLNGSQAIQQPNAPSAQYNQSALRSPDIAGLTMQAYQANLQNYNQAYMQEQQQNNNFMSGLMGIGSALARPAASFLFA